METVSVKGFTGNAAWGPIPFEKAFSRSIEAKKGLPGQDIGGSSGCHSGLAGFSLSNRLALKSFLLP